MRPDGVIIRAHSPGYVRIENVDHHGCVVSAEELAYVATRMGQLEIPKAAEPRAALVADRRDEEGKK